MCGPGWGDLNSQGRGDVSGKPKGQHGGRRERAGRPVGSRNALPLNAVQAIRALRYRVPAGTPEPLAEVAGEAFERVVAVMRGEVLPDVAATVLKAATVVRHEVCGPLAQKLEHTGKDGEPLQVSIEITRTVREE